MGRAHLYRHGRLARFVDGLKSALRAQATNQVGLAQQYNAFSGKAAGFGLVSQQDASIEQYVTGKTLDGLFLVIGEQEQQWRQNPAAAGSAIVKKVFGALR